MDLPIWIPDWNSLDSVRRAHSWLEAAALIFFALLVVSDVLANMHEDKNVGRARLLEKYRPLVLCYRGSCRNRRVPVRTAK